MADLRSAGCDLLTITQYLRPSLRHHPVERWVKPEEFVELREDALAMGFAGVHVGPAGPLFVPGGAAVRAGDRAARDGVTPAREPAGRTRSKRRTFGIISVYCQRPEKPYALGVGARE